jgi:uncharacterized membrane protein YdjX (TVP38/TMEM64 family)
MVKERLNSLLLLRSCRCYSVIFIPPTILIFGAGYAFAQAIGTFPGILAAFFSCFLGSCIGAVTAFVRSRYMMRDLIHLFAKRYPLVRAADRALKKDGFRIMVLLRLCPLIPFNGLNYCCGITGVSLHDFTLSLVGVLPFQLFTVIVGATAGTLAMQTNRNSYSYYSDSTNQQLGWIILICSGVAFGIIALVYSWTLVKQELQKVGFGVSSCFGPCCCYHYCYCMEVCATIGFVYVFLPFFEHGSPHLARF